MNDARTLFLFISVAAALWQGVMSEDGPYSRDLSNPRVNTKIREELANGSRIIYYADHDVKKTAARTFQKFERIVDWHVEMVDLSERWKRETGNVIGNPLDRVIEFDKDFRGAFRLINDRHQIFGRGVSLFGILARPGLFAPDEIDEVDIDIKKGKHSVFETIRTVGTALDANVIEVYTLSLVDHRMFLDNDQVDLLRRGKFPDLITSIESAQRERSGVILKEARLCIRFWKLELAK